jgi:hypothetical protein
VQQGRGVTSSVLERARLLALAAAGAVCGHAITYALCLPDLPLRTSVLRQTGHAYWHGAVAGAFVGALWFALLHARHHAIAGRRGDRAPFSFAATARQLGALQLLIFLAIEVAERVEVGRGLAGLTEHNLLSVGLAVQVVVAGALALAAWALGRTAEALGRTLRPAPDAPRRVRDWAMPAQLVPAVVVTPACGGRAPPLS